mgnify:CR=1 FL=1
MAYRTLPKGRALEVFERFDAPVQADLLAGLQDVQVAEVFSALSPEDRVPLLDELPATVANRLVLGLSEEDRMLTTAVLGALREEEAGIGSAVNNAVSRVAGLIAVALVGTVSGGALGYPGFRQTALTAAGLFFAAALIAVLGIRNPNADRTVG